MYYMYIKSGTRMHTRRPYRSLLFFLLARFLSSSNVLYLVNGAIHHRLGPLMSINHQDNLPSDVPAGQPDLDNFSERFSSQMIDYKLCRVDG